MVQLDLVRNKIARLRDSTSAIDLCAHVIVDQGWGPVASLRDHFMVMSSRRILPAELAAQLATAVKAEAHAT
jgi:uncharacterized protein YutE (UPF0331/DUF86 family)